MENYRDKKINNKLEFLNSYNKEVKIIETNELELYLEYIPQRWIYVFKENNMNKRIEKALNIWKEFVFEELKNTIDYLENNLLEINLITYKDLIKGNQKISILYIIKKENKKLYDISYFEGNFNMEFYKNISLKENWDKVPRSLKNFYNNVHNGFHCYGIHAGLEELSEVTYFDDYYCIEDFEEYENIPNINIKKTFGFFSNGSSDYVAIDISKNDNVAIIWYHDDIEEIQNVDFWYEVDDWLLSLFE